MLALASRTSALVPARASMRPPHNALPTDVFLMDRWRQVDAAQAGPGTMRPATKESPQGNTQEAAEPFRTAGALLQVGYFEVG